MKLHSVILYTILFVIGSLCINAGERSIVENEFEINGTAQGGILYFGYTQSHNDKLKIALNPGDTERIITQKLIEAATKVKLPMRRDGDSDSIVIITKYVHGNHYIETTDPGIVVFPNIKNVKAKTDRISKRVHITWELPEVKPDTIYIFRNGRMIHAEYNDAIELFDNKAHEESSLMIRYAIVCGYVGSVPNRATLFSDRITIFTTNPNAMKHDNFEILYPGLIPGIVAKPYSRSMDHTGGVNPVIWELISGELPPGITLSTGGVFSGTPTQAGEFQFELKLTDAEGKTLSHSFKLRIDKR